MYEDYFLDIETEIVFLYIARHYSECFKDIKGHKIIGDIINVFNYSDDEAKLVIRGYFSEFLLTDDWFINPDIIMYQDLAMYYNIDMEAELGRIVSNDIDRNIINNLMRLGEINHNNGGCVMGIDLAEGPNLDYNASITYFMNNLD
jgi:hypothetical protein